MVNRIHYNDLINPDVDEEKLRGDNEQERIELIKKHRGISVGRSNKEFINRNICADYILNNHRINVFRVDGVGRFIYNNQLNMYEPISDVSLGATIMHIVADYKEDLFTADTEKGIIRLLDFKMKAYKQMPKNKRFLVFQNGTYDIQNRKFYSRFSEKIRNTYILGYDYDKQADCPKFKAFLEDVFNGDKDTILLMQEILGYTLCIGSSPADVVCFWFSRGRSGKSVLSNIIAKIHGESNVGSLPLSKLNERFMLSSIYDKNVNICPEEKGDKLLKTNILKAVTGRDKVLIEEKYKPAFSDYVHCKIIVVSNEMLRLEDNSHGMWERVIPIYFPNIYIELSPGEQKVEGVHYQNPNLEEELSEELSGIFNFFIEGLNRLEDNNWSFTKSQASDELKNQLLLLNKPVKYFTENYIIKDSSSRLSTAQVHTAFKQWCEANEIQIGEYNTSRVFHAEFKNTLLALGIKCSIKKNSIDYYMGIDLNPEYANTIAT